MTELPQEPRRLRFVRRPAPVLAEHRPMYKLGQVLLVLHLASAGGKSRLPRLHLFNWALKDSRRQALLIEAATQRKLNVSAWGFDPALAFAIRFALAEGLLEETSTGYRMTDNGEALVRDVAKDEELFRAEKTFLRTVRTRITENMVEEVARGWEKT